MRRWILRAAIVGLVVLAALQLVPYGWAHPNPPIVREPEWSTARAEELARSSCYACHSNETDWPAYSYVAPMSWLVRNDVEEGRDELNFSEWDEDADDAAEAIADGTMPPGRYTVMHPDARLSDEERAELIAALETMDAAD